jgi:serine/threonine protein kinase
MAKPPAAPETVVKADFCVPGGLQDHARYDVLAPLGAGGMGTVYKARHRLMERVVALKIINPLFENKPGAVERFTR